MEAQQEIPVEEVKIKVEDENPRVGSVRPSNKPYKITRAKFDAIKDAYTVLSGFSKFIPTNLRKSFTRTVGRLGIKEGKSKKVKDGKVTNTGFLVQKKLTDEACVLLNRPIGSTETWGEMTRYINTYIKEKKLQVEDAKKNIKLDDLLKSLLGVTEPNATITFTTLQQVLKNCFVKKEEIVSGEIVL
jgi:chromatin remodeling complex protein RSC6